MNKEELFEKITKKKEFSEIPREDVLTVIEKFTAKKYGDEEIVKLSRNELRNIFSSFTSTKLLSPKSKDESWILRKHLSTRERLPFYKEVYNRILKNTPNKLSIIDLGSGINGFSFRYFKEIGKEVNYLGIEAINQLVELTNSYFKDKNLSGRAIHASLLDSKRIINEIKPMKKPRVALLFKVIDSLEMLKRDYSKKLIETLSGISSVIVVSFATRSMIRRKKFKVDRTWILKFIKENFKVLDDFEIGGERYICFMKNS